MSDVAEKVTEEARITADLGADPPTIVDFVPKWRPSDRNR